LSNGGRTIKKGKGPSLFHVRDELIDEFLNVVNGTDLLVKVVRLHQLLDGVLTALVNERLVESHFLDVQRIPFALRVELAVALGLVDKDDRAPLLRFNAIRNEFVYDRKTSLTPKESQDFYNVCQGRLRYFVTTLKFDDFATPEECVINMSGYLYILLCQALEHARNAKLWDRAAMEEMQEVLRQAPGVRRLIERNRASGHPKIRARFDELKKAQIDSELTKET